jgi:L-threonylcarbamoyladenylate synthase
VLVDGPAMRDSICASVPPLARELMKRLWPGALTISLPARPNLPSALVDGGCVAVRQSSHPTAQALVSRLGRPLTTTSANLAGGTPATTQEAVEEIFAGRCRILHGGATTGGAPSTLVRVRGDKLEILRRGAIEIDSGPAPRDKG